MHTLYQTKMRRYTNMRKILSLVLALMLIISCIPALTEEAAAVKTGLSFTIDLTSSKDGQSQANISLTAVAVDDNGVITGCVIDVIQGKVKFDETGKTINEIAVMAGADGKVVDVDLLTSCTINVADMMQLIIKAIQ